MPQGRRRLGPCTRAVAHQLPLARRKWPLSETREELASGAESHGWSMDGIEVFEVSADAHELDGESDLAMLNPSEVELTETTRKVLAAVESVEPRRTVFDSL